MLYYSEMLDEKFDTIDELKEAEDAYVEARLEEEKKASATAANRKELARKVDIATDNLNSAYEKYDIERAHAQEIMDKAQKESEEILTNARKKCKEILEPAKENIRARQKEKFDAVTEFDSKFGNYTTTITGDKVLKEMRRIDSWMSDFSEYMNYFRKFF